MSDTRSTDDSITAVLAAAERLALPVAVEYSRRPPPLFGTTCEVEATIRDDDDGPLAALLPMDVDAGHVATAIDQQAEDIATILNDAPLLAATLRDERGALARVLASPEGEAIVDAADRERLLELVAAAGGRDDTGAGLLTAMRDARAQLAAAGVTIDAAAILAEDREPLTVGAALASLPVVEFLDGEEWIQARGDGGVYRFRHVRARSWSSWREGPDLSAAGPCRLVGTWHTCNGGPATPQAGDAKGRA